MHTREGHGRVCMHMGEGHKAGAYHVVGHDVVRVVFGGPPVTVEAVDPPAD